MPPNHLNGLGFTVVLNFGLEKSGKVRESLGSSYCLENGNPVLNGGQLLSVKYCLTAKKKNNMKKHFFNKNLAGFFTFYFVLCLILVYSNIVKTHEILLTYDLRVRNTDPRFHLVSCYEKHFQVSNEKCCFL